MHFIEINMEAVQSIPYVESALEFNTCMVPKIGLECSGLSVRLQIIL